MFIDSVWETCILTGWVLFVPSRSAMAVMRLVGAQGPLAASRPSCTELLMRIMRSLLASSSAGLLISLPLGFGKPNPSCSYLTKTSNLSVFKLCVIEMDIASCHTYCLPYVCIVVVTWTAPGSQALMGKEMKKPEMDKRPSTWLAAGDWRRWDSAF